MTSPQIDTAFSFCLPTPTIPLCRQAAYNSLETGKVFNACWCLAPGTPSSGHPGKPVREFAREGCFKLRNMSSHCAGSIPCIPKTSSSLPLHTALELTI